MIPNWKRVLLAAFAIIGLGSTLLLTGCPKEDESASQPDPKLAGGGKKKDAGASSAPK